MARKTRKKSAAKTKKKRKPPAKRKSKVAASKKPARKSKPKAKSKSKSKPKFKAKPKGIVATIVADVKAFVDTLTDAEQLHKKLEPRGSPESEQ